MIISLMLVFTCSFFIGKFIADWGILSGKGNPSAQEAELPVNRLNVLLLGIDARTGEKDARSDSMILVSLDRDTKKMALVSIPRDTLVDIPGYGKTKINVANALGGSELSCRTVEDLLDEQIPYYIKTNFDGFKEIVDTLGGVEIEVEKQMKYPPENINLKPGLQRLNGYDALGYVRYRHDALGDITRAERQQKFLTALGKEMLQAKTIIKLPKLIPQLMAAVDTNLRVGDAVFLARVVSNLDSANIVTATLPGVFYNYKGGSYWKVDDTKAKSVLNDLFKGLKIATVTGPDIVVPPDKPVIKKPKRKAAETPKQEEPPPEESANNNGEQATGSPDETIEPSQKNSNGENQGAVNPGLPPDADSSTNNNSGSPTSGGTQQG